MEFAGKTIIITGGSSGIGKATAKKLSDLGAKVLITGRSKERLEKAANQIGCAWIESDVSKQEDVNKVFDWVAENWSNKLDVLINNAGLGEFASVEETPIESYHRVFGVNIFGPIMMVKKALPLMKGKKSGSIVNVASTSSMKGFANGSAYSASKFALRGFTQSLMEELRPFNIRVFQVNPSEVTIVSVLMLPEKAFVPELSVWATNPRN